MHVFERRYCCVCSTFNAHVSALVYIHERASMLAGGERLNVSVHVSNLNAYNVCFQGPIGRWFPSFQYLALTPITALSWSQLHFTMHSTSEHHLPDTIKLSYDHSTGGTGRVA